MTPLSLTTLYKLLPLFPMPSMSPSVLSFLTNASLFTGYSEPMIVKDLPCPQQWLSAESVWIDRDIEQRKKWEPEVVTPPRLTAPLFQPWVWFVRHSSRHPGLQVYNWLQTSAVQVSHVTVTLTVESKSTGFKWRRFITYFPTNSCVLHFAFHLRNRRIT